MRTKDIYSELAIAKDSTTINCFGKDSKLGRVVEKIYSKKEKTSGRL